jgi:hypothetical protein
MGIMYFVNSLVFSVHIWQGDPFSCHFGIMHITDYQQ